MENGPREGLCMDGSEARCGGAKGLSAHGKLEIIEVPRLTRARHIKSIHTGREMRRSRF